MVRLSRGEVNDLLREEGHPVKLHECAVTGETYANGEGRSLDWGHLSALVNTVGEEVFPGILPWNIGNLANAGVAPGWYPRFVSKAGASQIVEQVLRFCGWIWAARKLKAFRRVVERSQSPRGVWSPRTTVSLWDLFHKFPSPGRLERKLWKVRRRADKIFEAYERQHASWASIASGLLVSDQVGKAAVVAVAASISGASFQKYRDARAWLVEYHLCMMPDESDGVVARREATPRLQKLGFAVYRTAVPAMTPKGHQVGITFGWLVVHSASGRTYHSEWGDSPPEDALQDALWAWRRQDALALKEDDLVGFLKGEKGFCPLVLRADSYSAGNCSPGTESWVRSHGWTHREFIPGEWLIPYLGESRVKNVAMEIYRRYQ